MLTPCGLRQDPAITDLTATNLAITHRSTVTEDQIDHLGHMNVRFYGVNAHAGTAALVGEIAARDDLSFHPFDISTRHRREQLRGARLAVRSGLLAADGDEVRLYHELANEDTGDLAATFVHQVRLEVGGAPFELPEAARGRVAAACTTIPPHGAARSIDLETDPVGTAPGLETLRERDLAIRKVRTITPAECGHDGRFVAANAPGLTWGGEPLGEDFGPMLHDGPNGERMGWASMETRMVIDRLPRAGDRIQSFSAVIGLRDKTSHRIQWAYDVDREALLVTFEVVNLAFDTNARAPMTIPDRFRAVERGWAHEDLAPTPRS